MLSHLISRRLPLGLTLAAVFLILSGAYDLILLVIGGAGSGAIDASSAYIAGGVVGKVFRAALYVTAGVTILYRRPFGRILGLILLVIAIPSGVLNFAHGLAHGMHEAAPTPAMWLASALVMIGWYGAFLYLLCRKSSRAAFRMGTPISNLTESDGSRTPQSTHQGPE